MFACQDTDNGAAPEFDPAFSPAHCSYEEAPPQRAVPGGSGMVLAGTGEAALDLPVGTPLGGYTSRLKLLGGGGPPDERRSAYARAFATTVGVQTRPLAKALYLQAGGDPLLIIKADICVAYDRLVHDLERELAPDGRLNGRILVAVSHTHAGWATYQGVFHLYLGFDQFLEPQYQRLLKSLAAAGRQALQAAQPARIGAGFWDGWDPQDEIFSDRREDDDKLPGPDGKPIGKHKDNRLFVLRVDDMADQPLALLFHFPMHGTVGGDDNPLASVDATGHVELALEERFERKVLVLHVQGPAGDASPRGRGGLAHCDRKSKKMLCGNFARMESIGELAAPRIYELWQATATSAEAELDMVTRAVPNGRAITVRDGLRYTPYEMGREVDTRPEAIYTPDGKVRSPNTQFNVPYGAGLCGAKNPMLPVPGIEGASGVPYGSCVEIGGAAQIVADYLKAEPPKLPECQTTRTTLSALRLSGIPVARRLAGQGGPPQYVQKRDDLLLATLPGEPVSLLSAELRRKSPAGPERTVVLGYSQGHIGYILGVENWLAGGYEPSINIYGPLEGEWLMERSLEVAGVAWSREREGVRGDRLRYPVLPAQPPPLQAAPMAGQVPAQVPMELLTRARELPREAQPPATVPRVTGRAAFVFYGGDPGEDLPQVTLERQVGTSYQAVLLRSGRPLLNRGKEMILIYTPVPVGAAPGAVERHLWFVEWQAVGWEGGLQGALAAPLGTYRFAVRGRAGGKDYALTSRPFAVVKDGVLQVSATRSGDRVSGKAVYPVGSGYRLLRLDAPSDGLVPASGMIAVRVQSRSDGSSVEGPVLAMPDGSFQTQAAGINLGGGAIVTVRDAAGNTGLATIP
jgi:neutral ceramidase